MEAEILQRFLENVVEPVHTELGPHTKMLGIVKYFSTVHWMKYCATPYFLYKVPDFKCRVPHYSAIR